MIILNNVSPICMCITGAIAGSGGFPILGRPSYMSGVACDGSERSLFQCSHSLESNTDCNNERIAGVICQGVIVCILITVCSILWSIFHLCSIINRSFRL